jgi:hypothetical protein
MTRIDTTQDIVLTRIVARLQGALGLPEHRCYETLEPLVDPPIPKGGYYFLTVSPGDGRYDEGMQVGGGAEQLMEMASVTVTAYALIALDPGDTATEILHKVNRGMLPIKKAILDALVGHDLTDSGGNYLLRQQIYAIQAWRPRYNKDTKIAMIAVGFGTDFDWDITPTVVTTTATTTAEPTTTPATP